MSCTRFMDMHSGGGLKEAPYGHIYIEAPMSEAVVVFYNRFGHNPSRVSCTCCGEDYSISEHPTLEAATAYDRGCAYAYIDKETGEEIPEKEAWTPGVGVRDGVDGKYVERQGDRGWMEYETLEAHLKRPDVLVIRGAEIKPEWRQGEVPEQGYVWVE